MKISIVCTLFNRLSYLKMLMWNVFNYQDFDKSLLEFIVVDDGGSQDILSFLKNEYAGKNVHYIRTNRKARAGYSNLSAGRSIPTNLGAVFSKGEIIVFCDSEDFMLEPNHLLFFSENLKKANQIISANAVETLNIEELNYIRENYKNVPLVREYVAGKRNSNLSLDAYFSGRQSGYWAQRRQDYIDMGGFDERLFGLTGDDIEFNYRLNALGYSYVPAPLYILHNYHGTNALAPMRHWGDEFENIEQFSSEVKSLNTKLIDEHNKMGRILVEEQKTGTVQIKIPMKIKFYDDDIHVNVSKINIKERKNAN